MLQVPTFVSFVLATQQALQPGPQQSTLSALLETLVLPALPASPARRTQHHQADSRDSSQQLPAGPHAALAALQLARQLLLGPAQQSEEPVLLCAPSATRLLLPLALLLDRLQPAAADATWSAKVRVVTLLYRTPQLRV